MKKRIRLRGWVLVVLRIMLLIGMFFMACITDNLSLMILKTILCIIYILPILYLLLKYGD